MPIRDVAAQNASLDNDYGTTRGPNAAASHTLALFDGDPTDTGLELTGLGYARVTIAAADWAAAADGMKSPTNPAVFPAPTDAWTPALYWALYAGTVMWDYGPLTEPLEVTGAASVGPTLAITVFYDESAIPLEV